MKPEFVDNREGNTLAKALGAHLGWLVDNYKGDHELAIASGYFNPAGFDLVAAALERLAKVRLLIGAEPLPAGPARRQHLKEPRGSRFHEEGFRSALSNLEQRLRDERDLLGFTEETTAALRRLIAFLRRPGVEVRRYEKGFLHGKAFLVHNDEGVIAGSSNFTFAGLATNLELNLGQYQPHVVGKVRDWYESLWEEATPYDLASLYEARYQEYPPYLIYLRILWERYGEELIKEIPGPASQITLTTFQNDGIARAKRILDEYNGVIIADGVGLGKTFIAGELLREAVQDRRQRAILVSPASLRDGTWRAFKDRYQLYLENVSYEELTVDAQLGGGGGNHLGESPDRYSLVIVDEAHAFRNPDTDRVRALRQLLRGTPPKKLVLLTATPVNNSLWDLYYQLALFVGHDARFADQGIPSLKGRFEAAMREDPYDLKPDVLFDLLDRVVVRRTRSFVRRHYPNDRIRLKDGTEIAVRFPKPHVRKLDYDLDEILPGFFKDFADAIAPEHGEPKLNFARYVPSRYRKSGGTDASQLALAGLLRSGMLKRFESSVFAFAETARHMAEAHDKFLRFLERGVVPTPELLADWGEDVASDDELKDIIAESESGAEAASEYRIKDLRRDVEADRDLLRSFEKRARQVTYENDPKLARLADALYRILRDAAKEAIGPDQQRDLRKVLVFSYFADTVTWIEKYLDDLFKSDRRFAEYHGRLASVASSDSRRGVSREGAIYGFAPRSTEAPPGRDEDRFDVLVATDVLAEGLNLQQAHHIINYDLPWNPMRLVQRHGRIDRIGSAYDDVYIGCFFPAKRLDDLLRLEDRLRSKIAQAAASIGLESAPLPGAEAQEVVFSDTRKEIDALQDERPDLFVNAGEDPRAHSGEEYRQELRKGLERFGDQVRSLPWGAGSGLARGEQRGHLFCIRVVEKSFLRFIPADGSAIVRDTLHCLRLIHCDAETPRHLPDDLLRGAYAAWVKARDDVYQEWMRATDPANLQPRIRPLFHEIAAHLRQHAPVGVTQETLEEVLRAVEAPWGQRIERELREIWRKELSPPEKSVSIVQKVRELGLQPYQAPKPLDLIDDDEVSLVCWIATEDEEHDGT